MNPPAGPMPAVPGEVPGAAGQGHGLTDVPDAGVFLSRLVRLDPAALVRLRPAEAPGRVALWARLPWAVLVTRTVAGSGPEPADVTVAAGEMLAELTRGAAGLPVRRDAQWRWPLPSSAGTAVESVPAARLRQLAEAAAGTLRTASTEGVGGRAVGQRALRDALLDHVALVVTPERPDDRVPADGAVTRRAECIEIPQRLVQAVVRMGFLGSAGLVGAETVQVRQSGRWIGLSAPFGVVWLPRASSLAIMYSRDHPNG